MVRATVFASAVVLASADFEEFKAKYGKVYNGDEDAHKATYEANMAANAAHNAQGLSWTQGENQFSDLTQEQYRVAAGLGYKAPETMNGLPHLGVHEYNGEELAASVNWVTAGAVTPVKDQGQCGSCWAFSTTGSTEGAWQIGSGNLVSVSEQQLVDCATATSSGCQGGSMAGAIQYESGTAMATEASYPYTARDGTCKSSFTAAIPNGGVTGYKSVGNLFFGASKSSMQSAIQQQPVSIAIEADQASFQHYQSGVLSSGCGTNLDHGVLAVGYGTESGDDYWLVKNSWGTSWGMDGYIKISSASNVCGVLNQPVYPQVSASVSSSAPDAFQLFKEKYGKVYNGDEEEHRATYEANMAANAAHNAQGLSWTQGENQFSDLTQEQYRVAAGLGYKASETMNGLPHLGVHEYNGEELAASVNWVTAGAVTPVKDQGQCGSCWAFSTTGSTEGAWQIGSGNLVSVSEQQLVDCATSTSHGCQGGSMAGAIQYESGTAMATEASYPYTARDGTCKSSFTAAIPNGGVTGYKSVGNIFFGASVSSMQSAIQQQPVSIAIEADQASFQHYQSGVLSSGCGTNLDHGVLAVGYGTESGDDYWLVKNSWGTSWGMDGYIKISSASNVCGVLNQPVYPQVSAAVSV